MAAITIKHDEAKKMIAEDDDPWKRWWPVREAFYARFKREHKVLYLDKIIFQDLKLLLNAEVTGQSLGVHSFRLSCLAVVFSDRYVLDRSERDTAKALFFGKLALELCPIHAKSLRATLESHLALSLLVRAEQKDSPRMMDAACVHAQHALNLARDLQQTAPEIAEKLNILGNIHRHRYLRTGIEEDLTQSIGLLRTEIALDKNTSDPRAGFHNIGYSLSLRFELNGDVAALDEAISYTEMSLQGHMSSEIYMDRAGNLSRFFEKKFDRSGDVEDLRRAAKVLWDAKEILPVESSRQVDLRRRVCIILRSLFLATNQALHLEDALAVARQGLARTSVSSGRRSSRCDMLNEVALTLIIRSERYKSMEDARSALEMLEMAQKLALRPAHRATIVDSIANTYDRMFMLTHDYSYLEKAKTKAVEAISLANNEQSSSISLNAANKFFRSYLDDKKKANAQTHNLLEATKHMEKALEAAKTWKSSTWAQIRLSGGLIYQERYDLTGDAEDFSSALTLFIECWESRTAPLLKRIRAVILASELLGNVGRWEDAWSFLQAATSLIPSYCAPNMRRSDQQHAVAELFGLSALACAAGIMVGEVERALEILEQGRGLLVASAHAAVSELALLRQKHPSLHQQFEKLREQIFEADTKTDVVDANQQHYGRGNSTVEVTSKALGELVLTIRSREGFETFLSPILSRQMRDLANDGAIVVLNHTKIVSHAILVRKQSIKAIKLLPLSNGIDMNGKLRLISGRILARTTRPTAKGSLDMSSNDGTINGLLEALWHWVAGPVCEALNFTRKHWEETFKGPSGGGFVGAVRIWWMLTGDFVRLPMHAAGQWTGDCQNTVPKRAVSSYTASFRMLAYVRDRSQNVTIAKPQGLLVSMARPEPETPYHAWGMFLKSAAEEEALVRSVNSKLGWTSLTRPSADEVLDALPSYPYLHVASHGISDPDNPSASRLVLMKRHPALNPGSPSVVKADRVTVEDISRKTSEEAVLAFLAACCTADSNVPDLADEGLQIANAFQIAGFPHVIAALWTANDGICPRFAEAFYRVLGKWSDTDTLSNDLIALAANFASMVLIKDHMSQPRLWACFVHLGP